VRRPKILVSFPTVVAALALISGCGDSPSSELAAELMCPGCGVELVPELSIEPRNDQAAFLISTKLAKGGSGRFYAAPLVAPSRIAIFSPDGVLVRIFGERGGGPGENYGVRSLSIGGGDSIFIVDQRSRVQIFTADGEAGRSFPNFAWSIIDSPSGHLLLNHGSQAPLLLVDRHGTELRTLEPGVEPPEPGRVPEPLWSRAVRVTPDSSVWSVKSNYQIVAYDESGEVLREFDLSETLNDSGERFQSRVTDISLPDPRHLLALISRRDRQWRPNEPSTRGGDGARNADCRRSDRADRFLCRCHRLARRATSRAPPPGWNVRRRFPGLGRTLYGRIRSAIQPLAANVANCPGR
jgi:hypothetical protein